MSYLAKNNDGSICYCIFQFFIQPSLININNTGVSIHRTGQLTLTNNLGELGPAVQV
jgi:hypothetical protein